MGRFYTCKDAVEKMQQEIEDLKKIVDRTKEVMVWKS